MLIGGDSTDASHSDGAVRAGQRMAAMILAGSPERAHELERADGARAGRCRGMTVLERLDDLDVVATQSGRACPLRRELRPARHDLLPDLGDGRRRHDRRDRDRPAQAFTWLLVLFVTFFIPSALASAELGAALPEEGGAYVWVRMAFGRFTGALTSLLYWVGTPMWLGGSLTVVAIAVSRASSRSSARPGRYAFGIVFIGGRRSARSFR